MDSATIKKLRVVDLKEALSALNLSTKGRKAELADRLQKYYDNLNKESEDKESITEESKEGQSGSTREETAEPEVEPEPAGPAPPTEVQQEPEAPEPEPETEPQAQVPQVTITKEVEDDLKVKASSSKSNQETSLAEESSIDSNIEESQANAPVNMEIRVSDDFVLVEKPMEDFEVVEMEEKDEKQAQEKVKEPEVVQEVVEIEEKAPDTPEIVEVQSDDEVQETTTAAPTCIDPEPVEIETNEIEVEDDDEVEPYEQQVISPPAYADLDEDEANDETMQLIQEQREKLQQQEAALANLNANVAKTKDGQALVLETKIEVEPERMQAMEDFKNGKISKSKLAKIKRKLAKKAKKERDMKAFRSNLTADKDTKKRRKGQADIKVDFITKPIEIGDIFAAPVDSLHPQDDIERTRNHFEKVLNAFTVDETPSIQDQVQSAAEDSEILAKKMGAHYKEPKDFAGKEDDEDKKEEKELSKRKLKKMNRPTVAQLKQWAQKPDVVEMHDTTSSDPRLLVHLKGYRNLVPVPRHWCLKRKYLTSKRGFEKPPFELPDFIQRTGISEIRDALLEKDEIRNRASKQRQKMRPKLGKIHMDYEKLHDAFFRYQTKPKMTLHGDLYYEGKELEVKLKEKKPGELSDALRIALGMPIGPHAHRCPPPWLIAMQRYGPPPSFPNLKIPGLNAPIPAGCSFGYHAGGWGKPPVDEYGRPLYGDVFGNTQITEEEEIDQGKTNFRWGQLESDSESEEESDESEEEGGGVTVNAPESDEELDQETAQAKKEQEAANKREHEAGMATPSGTQSTLSSHPGMETPQQIQLRKRHEIEAGMDEKGHKDLFKVIPQMDASGTNNGAMRSSMMGATHTYDLSSRKRTGKMGRDGMEVALTAEELGMDESSIRQRLEQKMNQKQAERTEREDYSDMVREHISHTDRKRRHQEQRRDNDDRYDKRRR